MRCGRDKVAQQDLEESVDVILAGYKRKGMVVSKHEREVIAYHEVGHALVAALQKNSAPVHKITIIPRTSGALGYTMQLDEDEKFLMTREEAFNKIVTLTGGRAAEKIIFDSITTGASNDIEQATRLARAMIARYGMSDEFGMVALETVTNKYLSGDTSLACSEETSAKVDGAVVELVKKAYAAAEKILSENTGAMHRIAAYLIEKETISGEEFMSILNEVRAENGADNANSSDSAYSTDSTDSTNSADGANNTSNPSAQTANSSENTQNASDTGSAKHADGIDGKEV